LCVGVRRADAAADQHGENGRVANRRLPPMHHRLLWRVALLFAQVASAQAAAQASPEAIHPAAALVDRSAQTQRARPDDSERLAREALTQLARQPDADLEVRARTLLCSYLSERDRAAADREAAAAEALLPKLRRSGLRAGLLGCQGEILEYAGDNVQAMSLYQQAVGVADAAGDQEMLAGALFQRGYLRGLQGDYASGLIDLRRARSLYEKLDLPQQAATTLNGIAIVYNRMGDFTQAREYFQHTLDAQQAAGLLREQAVTWHNLGRANEKLGAWDEARKAFEGSLGLCREINYRRGEAHALRGLASVRNALGDATGAMALLAQADALQRQIPDTRLRAQILLQRGIALRQLKRPAESLAALNEGLAIFRSADSQHEMVDTYRELSQTQAELGEWRSAYERQLDFKAASDRLMQRQLDQRFASLKVAFDTDAKEKENRLLQRERDAVERALDSARALSRMLVQVTVLAATLTLILGVMAWRMRSATMRMRMLAMTDELTGLPNRRAVLTRLRALLEGPQAAPPSALMIADLDHFKPINDRHGHAVGDEVLRAVGNVLTEAVREPVFVGRLGGEEFLIVLPQTDLESARQAAERIREQVAAIDTSRWFSGTGLAVSLGVTVSRVGDTEGSMLRRADIALYEAKHSGRNRVVTREP
jgi:diguanylate cyclase (GGDEF)-like protein